MGMKKLREQIFGHPTDGSCCAMCGSAKVKPKDFKNDLSRTEFGISQMCQLCQDYAFAPRCEECGAKKIEVVGVMPKRIDVLDQPQPYVDTKLVVAALGANENYLCEACREESEHESA